MGDVFSGIASGLTGALGLATGINNLAGGGPQTPNVYQPRNQAVEDLWYQQNLPRLIHNADIGTGSATPGLETYLQQLSTLQQNPYAQQQQAGANQLSPNMNYWGNALQLYGGEDMTRGQNLYNTGMGAYNTLTGAGQGINGMLLNRGQNLFDTLMPIGFDINKGLWDAGQGVNQTLEGIGSNVWNTAQDPQNALYNRTQQQVMDQQNAILAQQGVAGTPYGAGVAGQTASNFNIDWQNQQLQRLALGAQTANALYGTGASALQGLAGTGASALQGLSGTAAGGLSSLAGTGASALQGLYGTGLQGLSSLSSAGQRSQALGNELLGSGFGYVQQGAGLPYNTYMGQIQGGLQGLQGGLSALGTANSLYPMNDIQSYLGLGQSAAGYGAQNSLQQYLMNQAQLGQVGSSLNSLSNNPFLASLFNGGGGGGGQTWYDPNSMTGPGGLLAGPV